MEKLTRRIVASAAARLPEFMRVRYAEEWLADLAEREGAASKLCLALGCVWCVFKTTVGVSGMPTTPPIRMEFSCNRSFETDEITGLRTLAYWIFPLGLIDKDERAKSILPVALSFVQRTHHLISHEESHLSGQNLYTLSGGANSKPVIYLDGAPLQFEELAIELELRFRKYCREFWDFAPYRSDNPKVR